MAGDNMPLLKYLSILLFFSTYVIGVLGGPSDVTSSPVTDVKDVYQFLVAHNNISSYDTALVYVSNGLEETINLSIQTTECYQCKLLLLGSMSKRESVEVQVDTAWPVIMEISLEDQPVDNATVCRMTYHFKQNGNYTWYINNKKSMDSFDCKLVATNSPPDAFIPIYVTIGIFAAMAIFCILYKQICSSGSIDRFLNYLGMERVVSSDLGTPSNPVAEADSNSIQRPSRDKPKRLKSLDAFRGFSLVIMIFVNYGSGKYHSIFGHSPWNGV